MVTKKESETNRERERDRRVRRREGGKGGEGDREERRQRNRETEKTRRTNLYFIRGCRSLPKQIARKRLDGRREKWWRKKRAR